MTLRPRRPRPGHGVSGPRGSKRIWRHPRSPRSSRGLLGPSSKARVVRWPASTSSRPDRTTPACSRSRPERYSRSAPPGSASSSTEVTRGLHASGAACGRKRVLNPWSLPASPACRPVFPRGTMPCPSPGARLLPPIPFWRSPDRRDSRAESCLPPRPPAASTRWPHPYDPVEPTPSPKMSSPCSPHRGGDHARRRGPSRPPTAATSPPRPVGASARASHPAP